MIRSWLLLSKQLPSTHKPSFPKFSKSFQYSSFARHIQGSKFALLVFLPWFSQLFPKLSGWEEYEAAFRVFDKFFQETAENRNAVYAPGDKNDFIDVYLNEMKNCSDPSSSFYEGEGSTKYVVNIFMNILYFMFNWNLIFIERNLVNTLGDLFLAGSETTRWAIFAFESLNLIWKMNFFP